ncbi:MAG: hypothetical protein DMD26_03750 [Gemmatimonadetes bacterium]|nr:MAG: hypothetical protein DMD26_03750 [Gemmatimonadota bacterium]
MTTYRIPRIALATALSAVVGACATTMGSSTTRGTAPGPASISPDGTWPTSTREHVDLWLHGYAMLTGDTARVPFFRRGYRQRMRELRASRSVYTQLDANADKLSSRFLANPSLVNGQFLPFYFTSFQQIQQITDIFLQTGGDPRSTADPTTQQLFAVLNNAFPTAPDRDWLRLYVQSLAEENTRFYQNYWSGEQTARASTRQAVDSLWQRVYRPKLQRFLNNTQQSNGELILSLPLDGEGRTIGYSKQQNSVAVEFPDSPQVAVEAVYVLAHETVNAITTTAITDNVTPAEQRSGAGARYAANANVRAGAILLQRAIPDLAAGYMRYYLRAAGVAAPAGDPSTVFVATFAIPDAIRDAVTRQLEVVLGGI